MKVLFDFQIFLNQRVGGISRYFTDLRQGFKGMQGMDCEIVATLSNNSKLDNYLRAPEGFPFRKRAGRLFNRAMIKHRSLRKVDIVHPTYYDISYLNGCKKPVIITVHDLIYFKYPQYFADFKKFEQNFSLAMRRCDGIICISENTRKELQKYCDTGSKPLSVIHHGIGSAGNHLESTVHAEEKDRYFLYVGSRWLYKKFDVLAEAFTKFIEDYPDYKLVVVGGEPLSEEEAKVFEKYPANFKRIPYAPDNQLTELYGKASSLIVTSLEEGFCYPVIEALLGGTNVICTDIDVLREVAGDNAIYFKAGEPDSLINCMVKVANNGGRPVHKIEERFYKYYRIERMCDDTRSFYNKFR